MYNSEKVYRSTYHFVEQILPSGVIAVDGQEYGIRVDDPVGKSPSVAVTLGDISNAALELGTIGSNYPVIFTINAKSRMQRDALKDIIRSGIMYQQIPIYSDFTSFTPASGAVIQSYAGIGDYFQMRDMPNFDSDREKFFWNAVVVVSLDILGI